MWGPVMVQLNAIAFQIIDESRTGDKTMRAPDGMSYFLGIFAVVFLGIVLITLALKYMGNPKVYFNYMIYRKLLHLLLTKILFILLPYFQSTLIYLLNIWQLLNSITISINFMDMQRFYFTLLLFLLCFVFYHSFEYGLLNHLKTILRM